MKTPKKKGLKTNSRKARENVTRYILATFPAADYGKETAEEALAYQIDYMRNPGESLIRTARRLWEGGHGAIYYADVRADIMEILEQPEEEAARFSDEEAWEFYLNFLSLHTVRIYEATKKGGEA